MFAHGHEVNVGLLHVNGHLSEHLGGIGVNKNLAFVANGTNFINGLERVNLDIDGHDGDEDGIEKGGEVNVPGGGFDREVQESSTHLCSVWVVMMSFLFWFLP